MEELGSAVDSASKGDYSELTRIQKALQDPTYYLAFCNALLDSLQSKDIFVFHGLNLLVTAGTVKTSLYSSLKTYIPRLLDAGRTLLATGIAMKTLSKLIVLIVGTSFLPDEIDTFCTVLINECFTEVLFLLNVVEDLMLHIASNKRPVAQDTAILESIIKLATQTIKSMDRLMDTYFAPSTSSNLTKGDFQTLVLAHLKILIISVKWDALSKTCTMVPSNSDDTFFITQAKPLPKLLDLLNATWYNRAAKLFLLTLLRDDRLVYSCCQELFLALSTVTHNKKEVSSIILLFFIALLVRFYQFQLSGANGKNIAFELEAITLPLDLNACIFGVRPPNLNIALIAANFFHSNAWLNIPHNPEDDFFPIQIIQYLIRANGSVTMLSVLNKNQITRLLCQFLFTVFFIHMTVSQELDFLVSYLDSLMSIVHNNYQACLIGPSFHLVSPEDSRNSSFVLALNSFLLSLYCRASTSLYVSQVQAHIAKCLELLGNKEPTPRNIKQYSVRNCSNDCVLVLREFSLDLYTVVRHCCLPDNRALVHFDFIRFCQDSAIFERIHENSALPLTDPTKLDSVLATVLFISILFFGIRDDLLAADEEGLVGVQPTYLCMASIEMIISQQCKLASTALCLITRGLSGECSWSTAIAACFYTQLAIRWVQYMLYDSDDITSYTECLNAASRAILSEAINNVLNCMGNIHESLNHINLSTLFLTDAIISTLLECITVMDIARKKPTFPLDVVVRVTRRLNVLYREIPMISTCDFTGFLLKYRSNILKFGIFLVEHVAPEESSHLLAFADSILSIGTSCNLATDSSLILENLTLLLSVSAGGLAALENLSINECDKLKNPFLDKIFAAYTILLPCLESLPTESDCISFILLARDIFLFVKRTIDKWLKCIGPHIISFFERLLDSSFGLLYRSFQATMNWTGISSERCSSLHHVYSGEDVTSVAFSGQEQLYLTFLTASAIVTDALYEITNSIPSSVTLHADEYKGFVSHLFMSVLTTILSFTPILDRVDDSDIAKIVDMATMILNLDNDTLEQEDAARTLTALCAFLDNLPPVHVSLKIKLFGHIAAFANALLGVYKCSDQLEKINQIYIQVIEKSIGKLIYCVYLKLPDEEIVSDLAASLLYLVCTDIGGASRTVLQFRQSIFRLQALEAIQALGVEDCVPSVDSAFSNMQEIILEGSKDYNVVVPIRKLLFTIHAACIKRAATLGL